MMTSYFSAEVATVSGGRGGGGGGKRSHGSHPVTPDNNLDGSAKDAGLSGDGPF